MNDETRQKLIEQLRRDEGDPANSPRLLKMYLDSQSVPTLGIGHNLRDRAITIAAALHILSDDLEDTERDLLRALPWITELPEPRYAALLNMAFNLGVGGVLGFRQMLTAMQRNDWASVELHALDSVWSTQVGDRARRIARQLRTNEWV